MASIRTKKNKDGDIISYEIRVYKGRDLNGKQLNPYLMTWKVPNDLTERQIKKELNKQAVLFEKQCKDGLVADSRQTFEEYSNYVMALKERNGIKHSTLTRYKQLLDRIFPIIGFMKISEIRPQHLNNLYEQLSQNGMNLKTGGYLSKKTIREYHRVISVVLTQAEKELLIPYNPADKASPPTPERKEANYFQTEDITAIITAAEQEPIKWKTLIHLLLITGARRGEIAGLKWEFVDWEEERIHICNNLLYSPDVGLYETTPKNYNSNRFIKLPIETMELLRDYRKWCLEQKLLYGSQWIDSGFVFITENGSPMRPDTITAYTRKFSERNNLPHINPHAFRHTMASILYFNGMNSISISKRLGHASVSTTTDIYSHIIKQSDIQSAECIADAFIRPNKKATT